MSLSLKQSTAIQALAHALRDFLPGSGARQWKGHVTFGTVAQDVGVGRHWATRGSKVPRLVRLLEGTLQQRPQQFEKLILCIVREGLRYRSGRGEPITPEEIKTINGHLLDLGFQFPDLWDQSFLTALALDDAKRAQANVQTVERQDEIRSSATEEHRQALLQMKTRLEQLFVEPNRQEAGLALEKLLNAMFSAFGLAPREPFRVVGEQIDGSFELDHELYLLEAKWEAHPIAENELLVFRGKIEGKSPFTRGVFLAMNGISAEAQLAIKMGKQPTFFVMTGHDLMMVLQGSMGLDDFLRRRRRLLAEEGAVAAAFDRVSP